MKNLFTMVKNNNSGVIAAGVAAASALFIFWGYQYGTENHAIVVPFLKKSINPGLYPGDYLLEQKLFFFNYFWDFLGGVVKYTGIPITLIFFCGYVGALFLFFVAFYQIAQKLFADWRVSILALLILLCAPFNPLGGTGAFGVSLGNQTASIPLCLGAICLFLEKRYRAAFILTGMAFYIHPLSAFYTFVLLCAGLYSMPREIGKKTLSWAPLLFVIITCPLWIKRMAHAPTSLNFIYAEPTWLRLLHMRSGGHIDLRLMGAGTLIKFVLLTLLFLWSLKYRPQGEIHRTIMIFVKTIFALCTAAFFFTEILPATFVIQMQFFRSSQFFFYLAIIYLANALHCDYSRSNTRRRFMIVAFTVVICAAGIRPHTFAINNAQNKNWFAAQLWARDNTPIDAIFITPPDMEGFRIESERTVYAEYKDGTQMFFNPAFGNTWLMRMQKLGFKDPDTIRTDCQRLTEKDFAQIAAQTNNPKRPIFAVRYSDAKSLTFPAVYRNNGFIIYRIDPDTVLK